MRCDAGVDEQMATSGQVAGVRSPVRWWAGRRHVVLPATGTGPSVGQVSSPTYVAEEITEQREPDSFLFQADGRAVDVGDQVGVQRRLLRCQPGQGLASRCRLPHPLG